MQKFGHMRRTHASIMYIQAYPAFCNHDYDYGMPAFSRIVHNSLIHQLADVPKVHLACVVLVAAAAAAHKWHVVKMASNAIISGDAERYC